MENQELEKDVKEEAATQEEVVESHSDEEVATDSEQVKDSAAEDYKSKFLYAVAEMENLKKRFQREKEGLIKYAGEKVLSELIEVVDNLERTVTALEADSDEKVKNIVFGINMVKKQFIETLEKNGLKQIEALGKEFDPNYHEAMGQDYKEDKAPSEILQEYQKGYLLNGRLLRASKVIVNKASKEDK